MLVADPQFITRAPRDLPSWAAAFAAGGLPVLAATATEIEALRLIEDGVDAHLLAEAIGSDPLVLLKVMAHLALLRRGRGAGEVESLTAALVMLGIPPFFVAFGAQATVEDILASAPEALAGFQRVLRRSHRAARFALGLAAHRMDPDAGIIHDAALLHGIAELLLWLRAPPLAIEISRRLQADTTLRSARAQREVLNIELAALQHALMVAWQLPTLLVAITDEYARRDTPQSANVRLAIRLARHSETGWDNSALPGDFAEVSALVQLSPTHVERLLRDIEAG